MAHHTLATSKEALPLALELCGITKHFGAVRANHNIDLRIKRGSIHGIVGENGAGKSTLMSIIYGFYQADRGTLSIDGKPLKIQNSDQAIKAGVGMVHQHFMLVDNFTVLENVILGAEGGSLLKQGEQQARKSLDHLAHEYGLSVPLDAVVEDLSVGMQQRIEILKALYRGACILILDEPTGVLTPQETDELFRIFCTLKERGVTIILITHKLREIMAITDHVSVMRQGEIVEHYKTSETSTYQLAETMVGRKIRQDLDKAKLQQGQTRLRIKNLYIKDTQNITRVKQLNFEVAAGEIVGIAGVSGNGQSELLQALAGILPVSNGEIWLDETCISAQKPCSPDQLRQLSLAHVPEDRHRMGLILPFQAYQSAVLGYHHSDQYNHRWLMNHTNMQQQYAEYAESYDIRPRDPYLKSANFSGGNQQKIVLAREIEADPNVLLIGQPTRGVDIGAIEFIHQRILAMRDAGKAIILVSVELDEIMSLADRILVMCDGEITGEVSAAEANEQTLGLLMANAQTTEVST